MESSLDEPGSPGDSPGPSPQAAAFELCELVGSLVVANEASAIAALELAARAGGADAALFVWVIPDDDRCWYRSIAALDPEWSASALRRLHSGPCTWLFDGESGPMIYSCDYTGAVSVSINGAPFARTWWTMAGDTVTEFSPAAKTQLGTWDTRFDDDYAAWLASLPPPAPPTDSGY